MENIFFDLVYPVIVVVILFGLVLSIHLLCQYFIRIRSDKKILIWGLEIFFIVLSTYPFFLLGYSTDPFLYWIKSVISLPLIFFIPGFLLYTQFSQKITYLKSSTLGFAEVIFIQILISVMISGFMGLLLAQLGFFSLFAIDLALLCICVIIAVISKSTWISPQFPKPRLEKTTYVLIAILFLALALFFHPFPWILGGRDPGVYMNTGVNIANTGTIIIHDPFLANMDSTTQKLFYPIITQPDYLNIIKHEGFQFLGFYITNAQTGEITPQFFYLWPVWIAIFHSIFGLEGVLYSTPFFAILGLLSVYLLGKILYNNIAGLIASLILVLNFALIWYSRYPTSESFTMFVVFSGILAFIIFMKTNSPVYSFLAAVCFGELLLTRIDSVLIVIPPLIFVIGSGINEKFRKGQLAFLIPFILLSCYAIFVASVISAPYTYDIFGISSSRIFQEMFIQTENYGVSVSVIAAIVSMLAMAMLLMKKKITNILRKISTIFNNIINNKRTSIVFTIFIAIILTIYVIFNYFIRPSGNMDSDSFNLVKLSWYTAGLIGISVAAVGILVLIRKKPCGNQLFFLSVFGIFTVYQIMYSNIAPDQPWWVRRYLPIIIPSMIICMGCCIAWLGSRDLFNGKFLTLRRGIACTLLLLIIVPQGISDSAIIFHSEYDGAMGDINNISQKFDSDGIIVYKSNYYTEKIALPLHYIYNRNIVTYTPSFQWETYISSSEFMRTLLNWRGSGKTVYLIDAFDTNDIIAPPEGNKFTYYINWKTLNRMSFDNYYNYIIIPQKPKMEQHTLNVLILNRTNPVKDMFFLNGNWHSLEYWDNIPTRYIIKNANILYHANENHSINLTFKAKSFYRPRTLEIYSGDILQIQQIIPPSFVEVSVKIPLNNGENNIRLYVPEGCERPSDIPNLKTKDARCLSIAIQNVTIN